jgi:glycosyltransferase involved in cell wall biosynthesis
MIRLSAVIITYNEEKNIERCLQSLQGVADEIVVLDSFSTDSTPSICKGFSVQFYQHAFDGHIQQKNRAITYATSPFVLSLDADEALDDLLKQAILKVKQNWTKDGYYMNRLTYYCGHWVKYCNWYPDKKLRLWDSRKGQWTGVNPHDKYEMHAGDSATSHIEGDILHYSYYTLDDHYKQVEYFTTIAAKAHVDMRKQSYWFQSWLNPIIKFINIYILHLGILDGKAGYLIARISAYATYLKYTKIKQIKNGAKP